MNKPISPCPNCMSKSHVIVDKYKEIKPNGKPNPRTYQFPEWEVLILKCADCGKGWRDYR